MKIYTHPANYTLVRSTLSSTHSDVPSVDLIPILTNDSLPIRNIERKWYPPPPSKFVTYEESDEYWMRPAGYGTDVFTDKGPLIYVAN